MIKSQDYTLDKDKLSVLDLSEKANICFEENGFCLIENVIPQKEIVKIKDEIINARVKINNNLNKYKEEFANGKNDEELICNPNLELRYSKFKNRPLKPVNDIYWMPNYSRYLADDHVVHFARKILDDHLRISQLHPKVLAEKNLFSKVSITNDNFGLPRIKTGNEDTREWHTDWPHDPWAYGSGDKEENIGCIRQPYPNITMCLVMIWFLTDVDHKNGGTWIVPKSHKFSKTPRGAKDNVSIVSPVPGEMQVEAKAGSVFIQDSRLWHSSPINMSDKERVAVINRWNPWWLSVDDFAPLSRFNIVCRPLSINDFEKLPNSLKPLMSHLCPEIPDRIQKPLLDRSKLAAEFASKQYKDLEKNPADFIDKNKNLFKN
tara:strand:- start:5713 stop:6840 length:1128 start_codon:yes stop_codon:yes gene_type:complete